MKIGFVIEDRGLSNIDFSNVECGNPGVGGTVFEEIILANKLSQDNCFDVYLFVTNSSNTYINRANVQVVKKLIDIPKLAEKAGIDILVFCTGKSNAWYTEIEKYKIRYVAWAHGFLNYYELKKLRRSSKVKRVVFVGKNMYYSYLADDIIKKSSYIFNMYNPSFSPLRTEYSNDVCYLGALNRYKGFHVLAKAWPLVLEKVPDAKLYVIGRGDLYNRNSKLGKYRIAENSYEKKFIKYLLGSNGKIHESVIFKGNLGEEKKNLISKMSVGIVNPTAITETFCISAIEVNACGVPVCTRGAYGLLDTVIDKKTGLFSNNHIELANNIVLLLTNKKMNDGMSVSCIENAKRFTPDRIVVEWKKLFSDVNINKGINTEEIDKKYAALPKRVLFNLRIKKGMSALPSFIKYEYFFKNMGRVYFRDLIYHMMKRGDWI